ncbi:hypothetical protein [Actinoplanes sp. NPDC026619]
MVARSWLDNTRAALVRMCADVAPRLAPSPAVAAWCAVPAGIEAIRDAMK